MGAPISDSFSELSATTVVCTACWTTFDDPDATACPQCGQAVDGAWPRMPYLFRNRYLFDRLLGRGGMGAVFAARDLMTDTGHGPERVAVKVAQKLASPEDEERRALAFVREGRAATFLGHGAHFVRVLGYEAKDPACLVMEYISWPTLRRMLRDGPLSPVEAARVGVALLQAVHPMHRHSIVHRDLKPENIFVGPSDREGEHQVKLADLGLWARADEGLGSESLTGLSTRPGGVVGTLFYMSPEQMRGDRVGIASDIHSVGSILWEAVTGHVPFRAEGESSKAALKDRKERVLKPLVRPATMPEPLFEILARALAPEPEDRYASALQMSGALRRFADGKVVADTLRVLADRKHPRRKHLAIVGGVAAGLLIAGAFLASWEAWNSEEAGSTVVIAAPEAVPSPTLEPRHDGEPDLAGRRELASIPAPTHVTPPVVTRTTAEAPPRTRTIRNPKDRENARPEGPKTAHEYGSSDVLLEGWERPGARGKDTPGRSARP